MDEIQTKRKLAEQPTLEERLPLAIEVAPGQAEKGLIGIFSPAEYEGQTTRYLVGQMLIDPNLDFEDQRIADEIKSMIEGGVLQFEDEQASDNPFEHSNIEYMSADERVHYLPLRIIQPKTGGYQPTRQL